MDGVEGEIMISIRICQINVEQWIVEYVHSDAHLHINLLLWSAEAFQTEKKMKENNTKLWWMLISKPKWKRVRNVVECKIV